MKETREHRFDRLVKFADSFHYVLEDENDRSFIFYNHITRRSLIVAKWRLDSPGKEFYRFLGKLEKHIKGVTDDNEA